MNGNELRWNSCRKDVFDGRLGPEARAVRDYVNLESPEDDQATLVQKVRSVPVHQRSGFLSGRPRLGG